MRQQPNAPSYLHAVDDFVQSRNGDGVTASSGATERSGARAALDHVPSLESVLRPKRLPALTAPDSIGAQKFRTLGIRLQRFQKAQHLKKLLITSSIKGEGKSVVSANLGVTLARRQQTLLIDGDFYQSGLTEVFGTGNLPGLKDWWNSSQSIFSFLKRFKELPLWYLPAGNAHIQPADIVQSQRLTDVLNELSVHFEWLIVDSPPLLPVADSTIWAARTDATLLIVKHGKTPRTLLQRALQSDNLKLLGLVANSWDDPGHEYYSHYYNHSRHRDGGPMQVS